MSHRFEGLQAGKAGCPSDLTLDRLNSGELEGDARGSAEGHVAGCATCQQRLEARRQGWAAFPQVDERRLLARIRTAADAPTPWWRRGLLLPAVAALAASVVAVAVWRSPTEPDVRVKGGLLLRVYRATASGGAEAVESGATFHGGERLRFVADFPADGMAAVVGVETTGALYTAWPTQEPAAAVRKGAGVELPGAVALDASQGDETLFLVHCAGRTAPFTCKSRGAGAAPDCGEGCASVAFLMRKP